MKTVLCMAFCVLIHFAAAQDCTQKVPVNVLDQKTGVAITSLQPGIFQAAAGKVTVPIKGLVQVERRRIVILEDESESMAVNNTPGEYQKNAMEATDKTFSSLLSQLPSGVSVAYGFFNDKAVFTDGFFQDSHKLEEAIASAKRQLKKPGTGDTALFDSLREAVRLFQTPQAGDTIVVVTDGGENKSKLGNVELETELRTSGVRLILVLVKHPHPESPQEIEYAGWLPVLATKTGGTTAVIDITNRSWQDPKDVTLNRAVLREFWIQQVLSGYIMEVQVPADSPKARKWSLRVNRTESPRLKQAILQYPEKLSSCPVSTAAVH